MLNQIGRLFIVFAFVIGSGVSLCAKEAHLAVLCYHQVNLPQAREYSVTDEQLSAHVVALKKAGFTFVSMEEVLTYYYQDDATLPSKSVLMTFDDGALNTYTIAWPILKSLHVPLTIFIYPTAISVGHKRGFMEWSEVRTMSQEGVAVGAHGFDHPYLPFPPKTIKTHDQSKKWLENETLGAKQFIEKQVSLSVTALALPFGLEDTTSYHAIKRAGYQLVFNISGMTNDDRMDPLYLNRIMVVNTDTPQRIIQRALTKPLKLKERSPHSLSRIITPTVNIHFLLSEEDHVVTASLRVYLSTHGLGSSYYHEKKGLNWVVTLPREQVYTVSVYGVDRENRPCFGSWSFIKSKNSSF